MSEDYKGLTSSQIRFNSLDNFVNENIGSSVPLSVGAKLHGVEVRHVDEFPSPGAKKDDEQGNPLALRYPGDRPKWSFSLTGQQINPVELVTSPLRDDMAHDQPTFYVNVKDQAAATKRGSYEFSDQLIYDMNHILKSLEALPMEARYPIITFGSNANPGQLAQKFKKLEGADKDVVPTLKAHVKGVVPVYAPRIGINGYVYAVLHTAPTDAKSEVYINFLSKAQLEVMNSTEKAYGLCEFSEASIESLDGVLNIPAYVYAGTNSANTKGVLLDEKERPVRLAESISEEERLTGEFGVMSQSEVQKYIYSLIADNITDELHLRNPPEDEVDLIRLMLRRKSDKRLRSFRRRLALERWAKIIRKPQDRKNWEKPKIGNEFRDRTEKIIYRVGRAAVGSNVRKLIPEEKQDLSLDQLRTFGEINT
jgi:hypothetical protein